jgi:uncharacterized protein (TIGR03437 family)
MRNELFAVGIFLSVAGSAAARDRISRPIDASRVRAVDQRVHQSADPQLDLGTVDPAMPMNDVLIMFKLSPEQQTELDALLSDQQNPSSKQFHKWLTPEDYANRFGLSQSDESKVAAWLHAEGFTVNHHARGRNWISFRGTAAQISKTLHTPIHRFTANGEERYSNTTPPSVPEALSDVVSGFLGLDNFRLKSMAMPVADLNSGGSHFLAPEDFSTIYNVKPLYDAGINGTGQSIAVVGESDVLISDIRAFRSRFNLPQNDPKMVPYSLVDPGFNGAQLEGTLDLEWAGAIAPKATIFYVFGPDPFTAIVSAVELNIAPVISSSYGFCEINFDASFYRSIAQQGNAQGITLLSASGDSGAAGCQDRNAFATRGQSVQFPAALPEVTAVGGTQFVEGTGNYWAPTNSPNSGSALSYIPEAAWNESSNTGLASTGGGASIVYPRPSWQTGPAVPNDSARHIPDIALSAAAHDAYSIILFGSQLFIFGTSASAPSMAGITALLNQYEVTNGYQKTAGLGNINPQLYRLAQSAPSVFHDIVSGNNVVPCQQGSPDCTTGSFGFQAASGYDMATGLGSIDANALVTQWNTAINAVIVTLSSDATRATVNDTVHLTATVAAASGGGSPTGSIDFIVNGIALGTVALTNGSASLTLPLYRLGGSGVFVVNAAYSGDASFSGGGAGVRLQVTVPATGSAALVVSGPNAVWPADAVDAQGLAWTAAFTLRELAGVPAMVTGFTIDGQQQSLAKYFPSPTIAPSGSLSTTVVLRGITGIATRTFVFSGTDANGNTWSRQIAVTFYPTVMNLVSDFSFAATPLVVTQNTSADPSCQWAVQVNVDDLFGWGPYTIDSFQVGGVDMTSSVASILGTPRLVEWGGLQGTLCFGGINPPATEQLNISRSDGAFNLLTVSFAGPPANPVKLGALPTNIAMASDAGKPATMNLAVNLPDKTQTWSASIFPANRTTGWLSISQLTGAGSGQITLTANGAGYEPGVYRATVVLQSQNASPQVLNVPVMWIYGGAAGASISGVGNSFSYAAAGAPGMLLSVFGSGLGPSTPATASGSPYPYTSGGVSARVNGVAAPILYASSGLVNIQIPYEIGAGPAVIGINNNGQIAGAQFTMAASAPGIWVDAQSNVLPSSSAVQGGYGTVFLTGAGEVSPARSTGRAESLTGSPLALPKPVLPVSVTVGGVPAFVQFVGLGPGKIGTLQINFIVPQSVPAGMQKVVVTVGGVASPAANLMVTAAPGTN